MMKRLLSILTMVIGLSACNINVLTQSPSSPSPTSSAVTTPSGFFASGTLFDYFQNGRTKGVDLLTGKLQGIPIAGNVYFSIDQNSYYLNAIAGETFMDEPTFEGRVDNNFPEGNRIMIFPNGTYITKIPGDPPKYSRIKLVSLGNGLVKLDFVTILNGGTDFTQIP